MNSYEVDLKLKNGSATVTVKSSGVFTASGKAMRQVPSATGVTAVRRVRADGRGTYPVSTHRVRA